MSELALQLDDVSSGYGSAVVLGGVTLSLARGEATAVLGKNGMGKTTLLRTIMGYLRPSDGRIHVLGTDASALDPHRIARLGVSYAAQEHAVFTELSIEDNLRLALRSDKGFAERLEDIAPLFPVLVKRLRQRAGTLSGGEQKMLLVARALMARPSLMLLDEITEGLQPSVIEVIATALRWERERRGTAMLLVEQHVPFALDVADRYVVLKQGDIVDEGECRNDGARDAIFHYLRV
ncbi:amino acid/amide ABC transporter ATP-binding protein 2, HAAT family (TC 3.A.1.4.-) [Roseateles sp. YR242]|uniref:branched-chain amino acid ABC transporter ATP-binding protein n=1 Tax=Roseateles sp. YR242 TaxID=1855305 RepID=UPI0008B7C22C|nr:ABC transporter ATP-binding protein [Roseateles sp. YR242]SEK63547.1 amino acid/amide ABC transporter ATP-binding protein 2, HAAT family (TC 3.A.1.4.-) [Roseateles sp. YR242]